MIAFYVSGHGFGHASRDIEVLNELGRRRPEIGVVLRTSAPRWIFDLTLTRPVDWRARESDTGVVQIDSLHLDAAETIRKAELFHQDMDQNSATEADWLRQEEVTLVIGDIPPLAFAAAARAGIPSIALGNFTWDWIYGGYPAQLAPASTLIEDLRAAYSHAALALRLPMAGGFDMFRDVTDLPFIARRSRRRPEEVRRHLHLPDDQPLVLLSFGGYGLSRIDLARLRDLEGYTIVLTSDVTANRRDSPAPPSVTRLLLPPNVELIDEAALYAAGYRYEDLVAAVDIVVTKPGYGIIAECVANNSAILYTSRGQFREYDVLVREMPRWLRCGFISNEDLLGGRWQDALDRVRDQPAPPERIDTDGAERAVDRILQFVS
jgi:L-arabinokinase